ncbi:MAG: peptidylprolyl isomerase [Saprospiraceae bacterium]
MRKIFGIFLVTIFSLTGALAQKDSDILLTVGKAAITVGEFKYIYEKNNGENANYSEQSLKEYLDLYTNFKLKVEKAKDMKMDTISELQTELLGYRKQLAGSYLIDKEVTENLLKELYDRTKYDIEFSHIFLPISAEDSPSKKDEIKSQMMAIKSKVISGQNFEDVAKEFSKDPNSASKSGYMGFLTAKLPSGFYNLESALYDTPIGGTSDIVESKIGFHIVKVLSKRLARGQIQVAHIFVKKDHKNASSLMDSLYLELQKGVEFSQLANEFSEDKNTNRNGGILPPFGINTYDSEFENNAFALTKDGELTLPFASKSGYHILKRIQKPQQDTYDLFVRKMKTQINKDERFDLAKIALIKHIKESNGFKENKPVLEAFISTLQEDFYSYKWTPTEIDLDKHLFTIGNSFSFELGDFVQYVKKNTRTRLKYDKSRPVSLTANELYLEYVDEKAIEFEEKNLEYKYPDFKSLMREYEEGILLFEVTKLIVWDKANQDSIGLENFYNSHKIKYIGEEKAKSANFVIQTTDLKQAEKIAQYAKNKSAEKVQEKFNKSTHLISVVEQIFEKNHPLMKGITWKKDAVSPLIFNEQAKHYSFRKILDISPSQTKSLGEARGYVVADYQDHLEKEWVKELKKDFVVMVNKPVLSSLVK